MRDKAERFEPGKIYTATDVADIISWAREKVQVARDAGLLPMYKSGKGWCIEGSQAIDTVRWWAKEGFDLSSPERILLCGQNLRKRSRA